MPDPGDPHYCHELPIELLDTDANPGPAWYLITSIGENHTRVEFTDATNEVDCVSAVVDSLPGSTWQGTVAEAEVRWGRNIPDWGA